MFVVSFATTALRQVSCASVACYAKFIKVATTPTADKSPMLHTRVYIHHTFIHFRVFAEHKRQHTLEVSLTPFNLRYTVIVSSYNWFAHR